MAFVIPSDIPITWERSRSPEGPARYGYGRIGRTGFIMNGIEKSRGRAIKDMREIVQGLPKCRLLQW